MLTICHVIIAALAEFWGEYWNCKRFVWIFGKVFMHHLLDSCIQLRSFHSFFETLYCKSVSKSSNWQNCIRLGCRLSLRDESCFDSNCGADVLIVFDQISRKNSKQTSSSKIRLESADCLGSTVV